MSKTKESPAWLAPTKEDAAIPVGLVLQAIPLYT